MILGIFWGLVFLYLLVGEPWARFSSYKRIQTNLQKGRNARLWLYYENIIRYWVIFVLAIIGLKLCGFQLSQAGFRPIAWGHFQAEPLWLKGLIIIGLIAYFIYYYFIPLVWARCNEKVRANVLKTIKGIQYIAPTNAVERWSWGLYAFNGVVEEFLFRGLTFLFIATILTGVKGVLVAIVLAAFVEAWRFIPRYVVIANVICTGLLFALLYYSFQSLYIGILIHFLHYLKVFVMPFERKVK